MKLSKLLILLIIAVTLSLNSCSSYNTQKDSFISMGTFIEITILSNDSKNTREAFKDIRTLFDRLDNLMSLYKQDSQINLINKEASNRWVKVDNDMFEVIEKSIYFSEITDGAFDITVAPIVELWGFGKIKDTPIPSKEKILEALKRVGYKNILLDKENTAVKFSKKGAQIDLGAIAKGFALEKAVNILKDRGIDNALINAGGNIYAMGKNSSKQWVVGIRDPQDTQKVIKKVTLQDTAIATSGGYESFFVKDGKKYCHIINPKTGYPAESDIRSASIISPDSTLTDALSTAVYVMGRDRAMELEKRLKGAEIIIIKK